MTVPKQRDGVAWITGASSGIGLALAEALLCQGWRVGVTARREAELQALAARFPGQAIVAPADVTDAEAVTLAARHIEKEAGAPVVRAIFNAGAYKRDTADSFSAARFRGLIDLNLIGAANGIEAVMPGMIARRRGQIALISSLAGLAGLPGSVGYSASKAAMIAMAEALKLDLDGYGVAISVVCPGFVKTPLTAENRFPMPFLMEVDDAARDILRGLDGGRFFIAFPRGLALPLRLLRSLPYGVFFPLIARGTKSRQSVKRGF